MWYEDELLNSKAYACDLAYDNRESELLLELSEECRLIAENENLHVMIRAKLYYDSFTSLSNYIDLANIDKEDREKYTEKILYLCRRSLLLQETYSSENDMEKIEQANFDGLFFKTNVNYCNVLSHIGRLPKAIYVNRKIAIQEFGMAIGNLGMELYDYGCFDYDIGHQELILEKVCSLFKAAISYPEKQVHPGAKKSFFKRLEGILGNNNLEEKIKKIPELSFTYSASTSPEKTNNVNDFESKESDYRIWIAQECLALNTLNDLDYSIDQSYDPIHLPNMVAPISEVYPRFHGLFNQIKQEYCSARFMIYEGIENPKLHFSDKQVFLVNTLDYPTYGLNIEMVKNAYRTIYSLFDRIGFFLNEYYSLGLPQRKVSFGAIWNKNSPLLQIAESNYILKALYWMKKDLYGNSISDYKDYIDPVLNRTYEIRNVMEHRYLKIISYTNLVSDKYKKDKLATIISEEEFHDLAINLLRTCRESIILLVMLINVEEKKKSTNSDGLIIPGRPLSEYKDDWKF